MKTATAEQAPFEMASNNGNLTEPIAIIGFGFKFPQDITNAESLWKLLMERRSTMTEIPKSRWNIDGFYKEHGHRPGTVKNRGGHFLADDPARFDAPFFSIQPAEAECMDPQHRLLLETSYHALENGRLSLIATLLLNITDGPQPESLCNWPWVLEPLYTSAVYYKNTVKSHREMRKCLGTTALSDPAG